MAGRPWWQRVGRRAAALLTVAILCAGVTACSDDENAGGNGAANNEANNDVNNDQNNDVNNDQNNDQNNDTNNDTPDANDEPDIPDEPDVEDPMDADEPDIDEPDVPDEPDIDEPDVPDEPMACVDSEECAENYACIAERCTIDPSGRAYVEYNYVLEEPSALTNAVSVLKGFFGDVGFFMIDLDTLGEGNIFEAPYGGADLVTENDNGPDTYAWQLPDRLPMVEVHPMDPEAEDFDPDVWVADPFTYELVAVFTDGDIRSGLGFEAEQTSLTMRFTPDLTGIVEGRLNGFITRAEAESRSLQLAENCLLALGLCPTFSCANDPPMETLADVLDCNDVVLDSDIDPNIEGHDAYRAVIFFQSNEVFIEEEEEE